LEKYVKHTDYDRESIVAQFVNELPVLRVGLGLSQAELAERIGISRQTYNSFENGKKEMPWTTFMALIAVFQNNARTKRMLDSIDSIREFLTEFDY
jgi:DNA-binding XRE family transcriptional regulator